MKKNTIETTQATTSTYKERCTKIQTIANTTSIVAVATIAATIAVTTVTNAVIKPIIATGIAAGMRKRSVASAPAMAEEEEVDAE